MCAVVRGSPDFYAVLHFGPDASAGDIGHAYRSLLRRHHPETRPAPATPGEAAAERELLQEVMDAHAVLADPGQRALYDRHHLTNTTNAADTSATGAAPGPGSLAGVAVPRPAPPYGQPVIIAGPLRWEPVPRPAPPQGWPPIIAGPLWWSPPARRRRI